MMSVNFFENEAWFTFLFFFNSFIIWSITRIHPYTHPKRSKSSGIEIFSTIVFGERSRIYSFMNF